jgi:hypothetical protein
VNDLAPGLVHAVLLGLGLEGAPETNLGGLRRLYGAWCAKVSFDNLLKLLHVTERWPGRRPGSTGTDFFRDWIEYRTGGTCWAGNGALFELCRALGFRVERAFATMLPSPDTPGPHRGLPGQRRDGSGATHSRGGPNQGSVIATLPEGRFVADASILSGAPLAIPGCRAGGGGRAAAGRPARLAAPHPLALAEEPGGVSLPDRSHRRERSRVGRAPPAHRGLESVQRGGRGPDLPRRAVDRAVGRRALRARIERRAGDRAARPRRPGPLPRR